MSNSQNIDIVIKAVDQATANIKKVQNEVDLLTDKVNNSSKVTQKAAAGVSSSFGGAGKLIAGVTAAIGTLASVKGLFSLTSQVEQAKISFETLLGSADAAKRMLADIDQFAAKTPFEKVNLTPLVQQLIGMGFEANKTLPIVQVLGDSMAALGRGQDDLNGVALALGQIQTKGKISAEELMQLAERGLPVFDILEKKLGLTKKQLGDIGSAGISSANGINALLTGLNERFGGAMAKQSQTLQGQWSNMLDNVKSIVGSAGQNINDQVRGWLTKINGFFDENRPYIAKFASDILSFIGNALVMVGGVFGSFFDIVSQVLAGITGQTGKDTKSQMKSWSMLFMVLANGVSSMAAGITIMLKIVLGMGRILITTLSSVADTVVGAIVFAFSGLVKVGENMINGVIQGLNMLMSIMGKTGFAFVNVAQKIGQEAASHITESWKDAGGSIDATWGDMSASIGQTSQALVGTLTANFEKYNETVSVSASTTSDLGARINSTLDGMKNSLGGAAAAQGDAKKGAKEHNEELKKLKETAEDAIGPILDKLKENKKVIDDAKKALKEKSDQWRAYRSEGLKALSDINAGIAQLKKEAENITLKINSDKDKDLGTRLVDINAEIAKMNEDIADKKANANASEEETIAKKITMEKELSILRLKQSEMSEKSSQSEREGLALSIEKKTAAIEALKSGTDPEVMIMQKTLNDLAAERDFIQGATSQKVQDEAIAYASLSRAQQIVAEAKKKEADELAANAEKMAAMQEKKMVLEAQANQKNVGELAIQTGMKDGIMTASIELEKGKRIELHTQEAINMANDIAAKQLAMKTEVETLTLQLQTKLDAQKANLALTTELYAAFNENLKKETLKTATDMIKSLSGVNAMLQKTIELKQRAGISSGTPIAGARADGGDVMGGSSYIVGEKGPELFTPRSSGSITPNGSFGGGSISVNINMGGVSVRSDNDIRTITRDIKEELMRSLQIYKQGIS